MKLKNGTEYIESLRLLHPKIYYKGKKIEDGTRHPATAPHTSAYLNLTNAGSSAVTPSSAGRTEHGRETTTCSV